MPQHKHITWRPLTDLSLVASLIDGGLQDAQEFLPTIRDARERPASLDDAILGRIVRANTERLEFSEICREQLSRWEREPLSPSQRQEIERLSGQVAKLHKCTSEILALAKESKPFTIDAIMRMDDAELGLATLLGQMPAPRRR